MDDLEVTRPGSGAVLHPVAAGIQLYVELPADLDEAAVVEAAARGGRRGAAATRVGRAH